MEDEASILQLGKTILEQRGYTVLATHSSAEALDLAQRHPGPIHMLITDVVMPEMNGKDLGENVGGFRPEVKCTFMSDYTANVIAHHGVLGKGIHLLKNPFSVTTLAERVRGVLEG